MLQLISTTRWLFVTAILFTLGAVSPTVADDISDCNQSDNPDLQIRGCSNLIETDILSGEDSAIFYANRGDAYARKGDAVRAIADYDKAIELKPDSPAVYFNRGNGKGFTNQYDAAILDFDKAIELDPDFAAPYFGRGNAFQLRGDSNQAIASYDKAIEIDRDYAFAYYQRGRIYNAIGELDFAIADFGKTIELNPDNALAYGNRGDAYAANREYDLAITDYDMAVELDPDYADGYANRGRAYFNSGDFEAAVPDLRRNAQGGSVYGMLWLFVAQNKSFQDADTELAANAASLESKEWPYPLVELYLGTQSAESVFAKAGNIDERCEAHFYIGEWHLMEDSWSAEGKSALRSAVETCPKHLYEYAGAVAAIRLIDMADCRQGAAPELSVLVCTRLIESGLEKGEALAVIYKNRGFTYSAGKSDFDRAIADYDMAIQIKPDYADAYNERGLAHYSKGNFDRAIVDYDKAIELEPEHLYYYYRHLAYKDKGDTDRAATDCDKARQSELFDFDC